MVSELPLNIPSTSKVNEIDQISYGFTREIVFNLREPARNHLHRVRIAVHVRIAQENDVILERSYVVYDPPLVAYDTGDEPPWSV